MNSCRFNSTNSIRSSAGPDCRIPHWRRSVTDRQSDLMGPGGANVAPEVRLGIHRHRRDLMELTARCEALDVLGSFQQTYGGDGFGQEPTPA